MLSPRAYRCREDVLTSKERENLPLVKRDGAYCELLQKQLEVFPRLLEKDEAFLMDFLSLYAEEVVRGLRVFFKKRVVLLKQAKSFYPNFRKTGVYLFAYTKGRVQYLGIVPYELHQDMLLILSTIAKLVWERDERLLQALNP